MLDTLGEIWKIMWSYFSVHTASHSFFLYILCFNINLYMQQHFLSTVFHVQSPNNIYWGYSAETQLCSWENENVLIARTWFRLVLSVEKMLRQQFIRMKNTTFLIRFLHLGNSAGNCTSFILRCMETFIWQLKYVLEININNRWLFKLNYVC